MSTTIEEVKKQLSSQSEQERLAALSETLNYGQQGLELLIEQSYPLNNPWVANQEKCYDHNRLRRSSSSQAINNWGYLSYPEFGESGNT